MEERLGKAKDSQQKESPWLDGLAQILATTIPITKVTKSIQRFVKRIFMYPEVRETADIENMKNYLETVSKVCDELAKNGMPKEDIKMIANELQLPLIRATMNAMLLKRDLEARLKHSPNQKSQRAKSD